ncbi:MAG: tetratricopeptide repeat protein [Verrucomicrobia bacterium]|nr:tetratricopeptide repeat protein [Verrucomicrobiota bacterium]
MPAEAHEQRKLAAIMFTDMVGYSAVTQKNEALALKLLDEHRRLLRPVFPLHHGAEIKTMGDAFMVEFASALDAVRCAIEMQKALVEYNASSPETVKIIIRIGIHVGDVIHRENDVFGDGVNIAARIEPLAEPGGICLSEDVARQVQGKLEVPLVKLGRSELKNIQLPVQVYRVALPWQARRLLFSDQLKFRLRQKTVQRWAAALVLFLGAVAFYLWPKNDGAGSGLSPRIQRSASKAQPALDRRKIVLLPLKSLNTNEVSRRFAEGLTEDLSTKLGKISELRVIPQQTANRYTNQDIATIRRDLQAGTILSGSVQQEENQLRISLRMIDAASGDQLWADSYDREAKQIFAIQTAVAQSVVDTLRIKLLASERQVLEEKPTENFEAYSLYLEGLVYLNPVSCPDADRAIAVFQKATGLDPKFAIAFVGLARAYTIKEKFCEPGKGWDQKALAAINTSLALNPSLPEAYSARGDIAYIPARHWDAASAVKDWRQALKLKPNLATAHEGLAFVFSHCGLLEEAIHRSQAISAVDPQNNQGRAYAGQALIYQGNYRDALSMIEKLSEDYVAWGHGWPLGISHFYLHQTNEAAKVLEKYLAMPQGTNHPAMTSVQAILYAAAGETNKAEERIQLTIKGEARMTHYHHANYQIGAAYALMKQTEKALHYLKLAADDGFRCYPYFENDPNLNILRTDPRL